MKNDGGKDMNMAHGLRTIASWPRHRSKARSRHKLRARIARAAQRERDRAPRNAL